MYKTETETVDMESQLKSNRKRWSYLQEQPHIHTAREEVL
jgi:hypothetical protein